MEFSMGTQWTVGSGKCPNDYFWNNKNRCMRVIGSLTTNFDNAKSTCKNQNAELLQFREEEDFLILNYALSNDKGSCKKPTLNFFHI